MSGDRQNIVIKGASEHNLKNIDLVIPRQKITVVTGVSGSGKSSLVFDTILAEAQRRFFHTLSYYTRQFLDMSTRPKFHVLKGLSPAIALAQMETQASPRATVGTFSDIAELLGVLFARFGKQHCPRHGHPTEALTENEILRLVEEKFAGQLLAVCAPIVEQKKGHFRARLNALAEKGYLKIFADGRVLPLTPVPDLEREEKHTLKLIVDYVRVQDSQRSRLLRSLKLAFAESDGFVECFASLKDGQIDEKSQALFSARGGCPDCGFSWPALDSRYFAVNSLGRCPECNALGTLSENEDDTQEESVLETLSKAICSACSGTGFAARLAAITLNGSTIQTLNLLPLRELWRFLNTLQTHPLAQNLAFKRVLDEVTQIAERIHKTGLGYLHLARRVRSLSGGEIGRLKLAGILSETLRGVLYILDEPSQGLHPLEINELLMNLTRLKELGNTIIVVDHDEFIIRNADWVVDLGPGGGAQGGEVVAAFAPEDAHRYKLQSLTAANLQNKLAFPQTAAMPAPERVFIKITHAHIHNLRIPNVSFLRAAFNVVCGVSGAGKTSLVLHTVYPQLLANIESQRQQKVRRSELASIHLIDRKSLAKSTVSMPITYLDAFTGVRQIFAQCPEAQIRGLSLRSLSLHAEGGRCEHCGGKGEILLVMKFLPDARVRCEYCRGKRYKQEVLDVLYRGYSIADILDLTIAEACEVFKFHKQILKKLQPAFDLGLGYLKLGQPTLSLSGGENQRLKLAPFMSGTNVANTVFLLDEPTRGLHVQDVAALLKVLRDLVVRGATIICIEHSTDVIRHADWIVELGPGAADEGGQVIFEGDLAGLRGAEASRMRAWI